MLGKESMLEREKKKKKNQYKGLVDTENSNSTRWHLQEFGPSDESRPRNSH